MDISLLNKCVLDVLNDGQNIRKVIKRTNVENLDLLPSKLKLASMDDFDSASNKYYILRDCLSLVEVDNLLNAVNDSKVAPEGYLIYTNHSYTGRINDGSGYERYATATRKIYQNWIQNEGFTPQWIFNNLSRSFYNSVLNYDLCENSAAVSGGWFVDQDFIPRRSSSASIVVGI